MSEINDQSDEMSAPREHPQFSLWWLMFGISVAAAMFATPQMKYAASFWVLMLIAIILYFDWKNRLVLALVLLIMFLPFSWMFTLEFRVFELDSAWVQMAPVMPGFFMLGSGVWAPYALQQLEPGGQWMAGVTTMVMICCGCLAGRPESSRWVFIGTATVIFLLSCLANVVSRIAYFA